MSRFTAGNIYFQRCYWLQMACLVCSPSRRPGGDVSRPGAFIARLMPRAWCQFGTPIHFVSAQINLSFLAIRCLSLLIRQPKGQSWSISGVVVDGPRPVYTANKEQSQGKQPAMLRDVPDKFVDSGQIPTRVSGPRRLF